MARKPKATDAGDAQSAETTSADIPVDNDLLAVVDATDPLTKPVEPEPVTEDPPAMTETEVKPDPKPQPVRSGGGGALFIGMVLGAGIAAAAGIGVVRYAPELLLPSADKMVAGDTGQLTTDMSYLRTDLDALKAYVEGMSNGNNHRDEQLQSAIDDLTALQGAGDAGAIATQEARLTAIEAKLNALATAPAGASVDPVELQGLKDQIAALQSGTVASDKALALAAEAEQRLKAATEAASALKAETEAATAATARQVALGRIEAAMDRGLGFAEPLSALGGSVPPVLADNAANGIPSLEVLRESFPDAARAALEAAINADMGASWTERVGNFLRSQTGARSLAPRDGVDPDAILSRAEAALTAGDVAAALDEISTLPDAAKSAMADWSAKAALRVDAVKALSALAAQG